MDNSVVWRVATICSVATACVAVALLASGVIAVRDTKNPEREPHKFTPEEWDTFIAAAKLGEFDRATLSDPLPV